MKFMLMIYEDDVDRVANMDERMPNCGAYVEAMKKAGIYLSGERLRGVTTATTVRVAASGTSVVDGPYAEAKEQLGGYHTRRTGRHRFRYLSRPRFQGIGRLPLRRPTRRRSCRGALR